MSQNLFFCLQLALVCFRLKGSDELNQKLLSTINASGKLHMVPASVNEQFVIRFCVVAQHATDDDIGKKCTVETNRAICINNEKDFILTSFPTLFRICMENYR